jgi:tetrahydromethanopterin S-methyltransferase subunit G
MVIEGGSRLVISEKDFVELRKKLDEIRHQMTAKNNKEGYVDED